MRALRNETDTLGNDKNIFGNERYRRGKGCFLELPLRFLRNVMIFNASADFKNFLMS